MYPPANINIRRFQFHFEKKEKKIVRRQKKRLDELVFFHRFVPGFFSAQLGPLSLSCEIRVACRISGCILREIESCSLYASSRANTGQGNGMGGKKQSMEIAGKDGGWKWKKEKKKEKSGSEKEAKGSWYKRDRIRREIKNRMRETSSAKFIFSALSVFLLIVSRFRVSSFFFFFTIVEKVVNFFFFFFCVMYFICDILCSIVYFLTNCKLVFISFSFLFSLTSFFSTFFL